MSNEQYEDDADLTVLASVRCTVDGVNAFVVTYPYGDSIPEPLSKDTSITFALADWNRKRPPRYGQVVELSAVERYEGGWRAAKVCPVTLKSNKKENRT